MNEIEMRLELGKMGYTKDEVERMFNPGTPAPAPETA